MGINVDLNKLPPGELIKLLTTKGLTEAQAKVVTAEWILETQRKQETPFAYAKPFAATDAACQAKFTRSFLHTDWVDGESPVQASTTPDEEGFNSRLHHIEDDLEALNADVRRAFTCVAEMRAALAQKFTELLTMVNTLNHEVHECCSGAVLQPATPTLTVEQGPSTFQGTTKFFNRQVSVWKTAQGLTMLPTATFVAFDPVTDPLIRASTGLAKFVAQDREVREFFGQNPVTKKAMIERFGDRRVAGGPTVAELVDILPDGATYDTLDAMVADTSERSAGLIRTTGVADSAIAGSFTEFGTGIVSVAAAPADRFEAVPAEARAQFQAIGVRTVGDLAGMNGADLARRLAGRGVDASPGDAAGWIAAAATMAQVR